MKNKIRFSLWVYDSDVQDVLLLFVHFKVCEQIWGVERAALLWSDPGDTASLRHCSTAFQTTTPPTTVSRSIAKRTAHADHVLGDGGYAWLKKDLVKWERQWVLLSQSNNLPLFGLTYLAGLNERRWRNCSDKIHY